MTDKYEDIINLPRHISNKRSAMPIQDRAAQFSPFAALTGHDAAVKETARVTERRIDLDQYMKEDLNDKLQILIKRIKENPKIKIKYFQADKNKDGGTYIIVNNRVKKIDEYEKIIFMEDNTIIPIDNIVKIEGEIFENMALS